MVRSFDLRMGLSQSSQILPIIRNDHLRLTIHFGLMISSKPTRRDYLFPQDLSTMISNLFMNVLENKCLIMLGKVIIAVYLPMVRLEAGRAIP